MSSEALFQQFEGLEIPLLKKKNPTKKNKTKRQENLLHFSLFPSISIITILFYYYNGWDTHTQEVKNNLVNSQPALLKQNEISFNLNKTSRLNFLWLVAHRMISLIQTTLCRGRNALYETLPGYKRAVKAKLFEL